MLSVIGWIAIGLTMMLLARLSRRMGTMTHVPPYYVGLYLAGVLFWGAALVRLIFLTGELANFSELVQNSIYTLLVDGLPALGITLALLVAWYYWSWLLAERD